MNANAVALRPPTISKTTPRSHVIIETAHELTGLATESHSLAMVVKQMADVTITCRRWLNSFSPYKNVSMTSRHTNASNGKVEVMLQPKQKRAMLMSRSDAGKLLRILPCRNRQYATSLLDRTYLGFVCEY